MSEHMSNLFLQGRLMAIVEEANQEIAKALKKRVLEIIEPEIDEAVSTALKTIKASVELQKDALFSSDFTLRVVVSDRRNPEKDKP